MKTEDLYHTYPEMGKDADTPSYAVASPAGAIVLSTERKIRRTEEAAAYIAAVFTIASKAADEGSELHREILEMQARIMKGETEA